MAFSAVQYRLPDPIKLGNLSRNRKARILTAIWLLGIEQRGGDLITLYHCTAARSFRPLWALEELGFPTSSRCCRFRRGYSAREYLGPQSARHHSAADRRRHAHDGIGGDPAISGHAPWPDAACGRRRRAGLWRLSQLAAFRRGDADVPASAGAALLEARTGRATQSASRNRLTRNGSSAGCARRGGGRQQRDAVRRHASRWPTFPSGMRCYWPSASALPGILVRRSRPTGSGCKQRDGFRRAVRPRTTAGEQQNVARRYLVVRTLTRLSFNRHRAACSAAAA